MISNVNPLRVSTILVRSPEKDDSKQVGANIVVKIINHNQPIALTESELVVIKKRKRGFFERVLGTGASSQN